jgi:hypothetical protein
MRRIWQKNLPTLVQFFTATGSRTFCKFAEGQLGTDEKLLKMRTLGPQAVIYSSRWRESSRGP